MSSPPPLGGAARADACPFRPCSAARGMRSRWRGRARSGAGAPREGAAPGQARGALEGAAGAGAAGGASGAFPGLAPRCLAWCWMAPRLRPKRRAVAFRPSPASRAASISARSGRAQTKQVFGSGTPHRTGQVRATFELARTDWLEEFEPAHGSLFRPSASAYSTASARCSLITPLQANHRTIKL
jgi:hypothetical protein